MLKKWFFDDEIDYLGHVIEAGKLAISNKAADAIHGRKKKANLTELNSFFGLCNRICQFV